MATPDTWPFYSGGTNYSMAFDYDGSGNQIYVGWIQPGGLTTDSNWRIMQQVFNGSSQVTQILWPNASTGFGFQWTNRANYSYS